MSDQDKTRVLLAEDDSNFGLMLKAFLDMNGFEVHWFQDGKQALQAYEEASFDIGVFDVSMPVLDGFGLAAEIAKQNERFPFVFLTAKSLKEDQIRGYKSGASDYLIKPFDPEILLLKIERILQSYRHSAPERALDYQIGNFQFDHQKRTLKLNGAIRNLSPKESQLLRLLCENVGEVVHHSEALLKTWGKDDYFTKQSMNVFISRLRKYLKDDNEHSIEISNLHGTGFILKIAEK